MADTTDLFDDGSNHAEADMNLAEEHVDLAQTDQEAVEADEAALKEAEDSGDVDRQEADEEALANAEGKLSEDVDETVSDLAGADSEAEASGQTERESEEQDAGDKAVEDFKDSLSDLDGYWYVLHTYSGYEKRVKTNVESRVQNFGLEDKVFQVEIPMEEVEKHTEKARRSSPACASPATSSSACGTMTTPAASSVRPKASLVSSAPTARPCR